MYKHNAFNVFAITFLGLTGLLALLAHVSSQDYSVAGLWTLTTLLIIAWALAGAGMLHTVWSEHRATRRAYREANRQREEAGRRLREFTAQHCTYDHHD